MGQQSGVGLWIGACGAALGLAGIVLGAIARGDASRAQARARELETVKPKIGDAMAAVNLHLTQAYFAGKAENWALATHKLGRVEDSLRLASTVAPVVEGEKTAVWVEGMILGPIRQMRQAAANGDSAAWSEAGERTITGCNSCHVQFQRAFIGLEWPSEPPRSLLRFGK